MKACLLAQQFQSTIQVPSTYSDSSDTAISYEIDLAARRSVEVDVSLPTVCFPLFLGVCGCGPRATAEHELYFPLLGTESANELTQRNARAAAPMIGPCPDG
jgi:hypothetical protein